MNKAKSEGTIPDKKESSKCEELIQELLASSFFTGSCNFSKDQRMSHEDRNVLIRSMMLLDLTNVPDYEPPDFSEKSISEYWENIRETYSDKQSNIMKSAIQYLTDAFPKKNEQLRKNFIPMLVYVADIAEDKEIRPTSFRQWFAYFMQEDPRLEAYKRFCSSNETKPENVEGMLAVMTESFCIYHKIKIPGELRIMVEKVEEKLSTRETG